MSAEAVSSVDDSLQGVNIPMDDPMRAGVHSLWEQDLLMDYKIKVGEQEFHVHKVIMSSMSDYFRAMLSGGMNNVERDSVVIAGVSAAVMEILINYIYTNHMDISVDNAADVFSGAVYFQMKSAIKICASFMVDNLDPENWFDVLTLFKSCVLTDAVKEVRTYAITNITDIAKADNANLPHEELDSLVQNWQSSEYDLFLYILNWVEANEEKRKQYAEKLLCSVRFSLMTPRELNEMQNMKNYCGTPNSWDSLIDKALAYHKLPLHQRVLEDSEQSKVRSAPGFAVLSRDNSDDGCFLETLKEKRFLQHKGLKIPYDVCGHPFVQIVVNNFLVVCFESFHSLDQFYIFDPRSLQWEKLPNIEKKIAGAVLAHDTKSLYVIGGIQYPDIVLDGIKKYSFETNTWSEFDTLPVPLRYFAACVFENGLYISGGVPGAQIPLGEDLSHVSYDDAVNEVYRIDLSSHEWETKAPMGNPDYGHQMQVVNISGEELIAIIQEDYSMLLYSPKDTCWLGMCFSFNEPPYEWRLGQHRWAWGKSIFMFEYDYEGSEVIGCQVVTFPEDNADNGIVENYGGYESNGYRTVLAIAPYTSEPGFGLQ